MRELLVSPLLNAGERNQYVLVENPTSAADGDGGYADTFAAAAIPYAWMAVQPYMKKSGDEMFKANTIVPTITVMAFALAADVPSVTTRSRLTMDDGTKFLIRGMQPDYEHQGQVKLLCEQA